MDFDERPYDLEQSIQKKEYWEIGFGLQATDNLKPSEYLVALAQKNIDGELSYQEIIENLNHYYSENKSLGRQQEADYASTRISEILSTDSFTLNPATLMSYHQRLFYGIDDFRYPVGKIRQENITKSEVVLAGGTVNYADFREINATLSWDFTQEKDKDYTVMNKQEIITNVTNFISGIWQIHPFREGNTRTTAVFTLKYLKTFGFKVDNEAFKEHSKFFRDALVLANASRQFEDKSYLQKFMANTFLEKQYSLNDKQMIVDQIPKYFPDLTTQALEQISNWESEKVIKMMLLPPEERQQFSKVVNQSLSPNAHDELMRATQEASKNLSPNLTKGEKENKSRQI